MKKILSLILVLTILVSCDLFRQENDTHEQIIMSDSKEITLVNDTIDLYEEDPDTSASLGKATKKEKNIGYDIVLVAEVPPVMVNGYAAQANDVLIKGKEAFIAYNFAGEPFKGAIQIIDISKKGKPEVKEEILFPSMDINALYVDDKNLIFGGAANPDIWGFKSFVAKLEIDNISPADIAASVTQLMSHTVTGISKVDKHYAVSTGAADGYLFKLNKDLSIDKAIAMEDARDVEFYKRGVVAISGTTDHVLGNGRVSILDKKFNESKIQNFSIPDFGSDYHKATIEVYEGNYALLALSNAGMKVMNLKDDADYIYEIDNPTSPQGRLSFTNSVTFDDELIFTANGEYGFRVFGVDGKNFNSTQLLAYYPYDDHQVGDYYYSANHVEYKSDYLFVACGVGGVEIYHFEEQDDDDDDDDDD